MQRAPKPQVPAAPVLPRKGRGAVSNETGRFEAHTRHPVDDGWRAHIEDAAPKLRTTVSVDATRSVIARNQSPDIPFEQSLNPYRGCEHGCVYCFARPTHAWLGLSPGLDFESKLLAKPEAAKLLDAELRKPGYKCQVLAMGTNTDPYQPIEREYRITRQVLEVLSRFNHPVSIVTKSSLVTRDIDILAGMATRKLAKVFVSITTLDANLARKLEPRAASPDRRLAAISELAAAGIPVGVMVAPVIPVLTANDTERVLEAAKKAGAASAGYILLRLPLEIKDLFAEWLDVHAPMKAKHVLSLMRETRGGKLYDSTFGARFVGQGPYADLIRTRFRLACQRLGLNQNAWLLDTTRFRAPARIGDQLSLL
ncbi:MAG: PA0069 family radical SAM protein [Alphaproteobacteria bacterium]